MKKRYVFTFEAYDPQNPYRPSTQIISTSGWTKEKAEEKAWRLLKRTDPGRKPYHLAKVERKLPEGA